MTEQPPVCLICLGMPGSGVSRWPGCGRGKGKGGPRLPRITVTGPIAVHDPDEWLPPLCVMHVTGGFPVTCHDKFDL
jgi:hypothetical protein